MPGNSATTRRTVVSSSGLVATAAHREFVLIKDDDIVGVFSDRSSALQDGYQRFGIVSSLVREITDSDPVVYLPNVVP